MTSYRIPFSKLLFEKIDNQIQNTEKYDSGTILELTAIPSDEWEFKEWKGDVTSSENPTQITIDKGIKILLKKSGGYKFKPSLRKNLLKSIYSGSYYLTGQNSPFSSKNCKASTILSASSIFLTSVK